MCLKINTGVEVSAISEATFHHLRNVKLQKSSSRRLYGPAMSPLTVLGEFTASISFRHASCQQRVFIKDLKRNLLGLPAITSLNLVSRVDSLQLTAMDIKHQYPQLFHGLGTFGEEYEVSLAKDAKPFALHTARNVPLPLHGKVQN